VTLKFLGGVETPRLAPVAAALVDAASTCAPFELAVRGLGAFPSRTRARVVWAGIDDGGATARLATRVEAAMVELGFEREARPFAGHVTLGRVRQPRGNPRLAAALDGHSAYGRLRVDRVVLMRSDLSPRGARYTELAEAPLAALAG
jgi:2'-5' RNA ligase